MNAKICSIKFELNAHIIQRQGVTQRYPFSGALCRANRRQPRDRQNIALRRAAGKQCERFRRHVNCAGGAGGAAANRLAADINHARFAVLVKMRRFFHNKNNAPMPEKKEKPK